MREGSGEDQVQTLTVSANGGEFVLLSHGVPFADLPWDASAAEVQAALEGIYGAGNVEVTGGEGNLAGSDPYRARFVGALAERQVAVIEVEKKSIGGVELTCNGAPCPGNVSVKEAQESHPDGQIVLLASNLGDAAIDGTTAPIVLEAHLPAGLEATFVDAEGTEHAVFTPARCSLVRLRCRFEGLLQPYEEIEMVVDVVLKPRAGSGEPALGSLSGGDVKGASVSAPVVVGGAPAFGVLDYEMAPEEEGGATDTQAGSHPFQLTTTLALNQTLEPGTSRGGEPQVGPEPVTLTKDLHFKLPPGLIGNPTPFPQCPLGKFLAPLAGNPQENECPPQTAVGVATVSVNEPGQAGIITGSSPLFNLEPSVGEPARFGFLVVSTPVFLDTAVRTGSDYGVSVDVENIAQTAGFLSSEVTFWGVPGDPRHDAQRGWGCLWAAQGIPAGTPCAPLGAHTPPPLIELPTSCTGPLQTSVEADSWQRPGGFVSTPSTSPLPAMDGCNRLPFEPSIELAPDGQAGATPTGLAVSVHVPQQVSLNGAGLAEADVKNTTVALPEGVAINPAGADGLQACSEAQIALHDAEAASCPSASKIGLVKIKTPLLPHELEGSAYLAEQDHNPFGSLVAMYVFAEDPVSGSRVKLAGEVVPDPITGQLVSTFKSTPQLPFETFQLHFFGGDRAPLATPSSCGSYTTTASVEPWSNTGAVSSSSTFDVTSGPRGGPCQAPLPFKPTLTAGTSSIQAGGYSPFLTTMSRQDGEQPLQGITLHMPKGVSGTLSHVQTCGEQLADAGACGPESLIGETIVSVGVGGDPYTVTGGRVYITGPYKGAPFGLSIVNPAKAGPYDLGQVVVRAKLEVNPETAAVTVTTDDTGPYRIPTIIDGIPLEIKHVTVDINRPGFTFNATNCEKQAITGELLSTEGAASDLSVPYQATNCAVLSFKPKFQVSTSGHWSRQEGTELHVKLGYEAGPYDANIAKVKVELPKALPSRLETLRKACLASVFEANPAACPAASIIGHAKATTPELPVPLEGPAYFVSHGGEAWPTLIIVLQGDNVTVHLVGTTLISKQGVTSSTFKTVPDAPVGSFELTLPAGRYSALTGLGNLCKQKLTMPTEIIGQNGSEIHTNTPIVTTGCPKQKKNAKHHRTHAHSTKRAHRLRARK